MSQATLQNESSSTDWDRSLGQIQSLVRRNTRRWRRLAILEWLGLAVSAVLAYLWFVFWLDNALHFQRVGRIIAGLGLVAAVLWLGVGLIRRRRLLRLSEDQVALAIEQRTRGGAQNRLINALQLARETSGHSAELSRAVIAENVAGVRQLELEQATDLRPALVRVVAAVALVAAGAAFYYFQPERFTNAAQRILLPFVDVEPLYRTTLSVAPGDVEAIGDVELTIQIQGVRPAELSLLEETEGKRTSTPIAVKNKTGPVHHTIRGVRQSRRYAIRGGDFTTRFYQITVPLPSHLSLLTANYR